MIAAPTKGCPRVRDYVTVIRRCRPEQSLSGQIIKIVDTGGDRLFWLRCPFAGGTIVIPHSRIARMFKHPKPTPPQAGAG